MSAQRGCRVPHRDPHRLVPELPGLDPAHTKVSTSSVSFLVASWALGRGALVQGPTGRAGSSEGASCLRSQSQRADLPSRRPESWGRQGLAGQDASSALRPDCCTAGQQGAALPRCGLCLWGGGFDMQLFKV